MLCYGSYGREWRTFLCCPFDLAQGRLIATRQSADTETESSMKADLVKAASEVITNQQILVNMVSRRVRQLCLGHRPMVEHAPGLREADIALSEIAAGKLTFESTLGQNGNAASGEVVQFPGITVAKKAPPKKKAA